MKHNEPYLAEDRSELFDLLWKFFLSPEKDETELDWKVRYHCELVLLAVNLEWSIELELLRVKYVQNVFQKVSKIFARRTPAIAVYLGSLEQSLHVLSAKLLE